MPASKAENFSKEEREIAKLGRAYGHPARVRILNILDKQHTVRNCDLTHLLRLSKSTVHDHIKKLEEAQLIRLSFFKNSYFIYKNEKALDSITDYLDKKGFNS